MKNINACLISLLLLSSFSFAVFAEQPAATTTNAYVTDDVSVYSHSGPGNQYRITGSLMSGTQIQITGQKTDGFSQFTDENGKLAWLDDKYLSMKPGLRFVIAELNTQLANQEDKIQQQSTELATTNQQIKQLNAQNKLLTTQLANVNKALASTSKQLNAQDSEVKKQWFFTGAIVLSIGLLFGLLLPKIFTRKHSGLQSWK